MNTARNLRLAFRLLMYSLLMPLVLAVPVVAGGADDTAVLVTLFVAIWALSLALMYVIWRSDPEGLLGEPPEIEDDERRSP